jgi:tRNA (guanosine-2'-O-)-methyltransferase
MIDEKLLAYLKEFISEKRMRRFNDILSNRTNFITVAIQYRSLDREGWLG